MVNIHMYPVADLVMQGQGLGQVTVDCMVQIMGKNLKYQLMQVMIMLNFISKLYFAYFLLNL